MVADEATATRPGGTKSRRRDGQASIDGIAALVRGGLRERGLRGWSLRAHLVTVVLTALALLAGALLLSARQDLRRARERAGRDAAFHARLGAEELSSTLNELRTLLTGSAAGIGAATGGRLATLRPDQCALTFDDYRLFPTGTMHIVLRDGTVQCSSVPRNGAAPAASVKPRVYADSAWLNATVNNPTETQATGPVLDKVSGSEALFVSAPIAGPGNPRGPVVGALALTLPLQELGPRMRARFGGPDSEPYGSLEYLVAAPVDPEPASRQLVAARSLNPGAWVGKELTTNDLGRADRRPGVRLGGLDGVERVYAGAQMSDPLRWRVYAGIPVSWAERPARQAVGERLQGGILVALVLALVTLSGMATVRRR